MSVHFYVATSDGYFCQEGESSVGTIEEIQANVPEGCVVTDAETNPRPPNRPATPDPDIQPALDAWSTSQTTWQTAAAMPQGTTTEQIQKVLAGLNALHQEHIAIAKALKLIVRSLNP